MLLLDLAKEARPEYCTSCATPRPVDYQPYPSEWSLDSVSSGLVAIETWVIGAEFSHLLSPKDEMRIPGLPEPIEQIPAGYRKTLLSRNFAQSAYHNDWP